MSSDLVLHETNTSIRDSEFNYPIEVQDNDMMSQMELFLKLSSIDIAFLFALNLRGEGYKTRIKQYSSHFPPRNSNKPYVLIEMNETLSADSVMVFILQNQALWSRITILLVD